MKHFNDCFLAEHSLWTWVGGLRVFKRFCYSGEVQEQLLAANTQARQDARAVLEQLTVKYRHTHTHRQAHTHTHTQTRTHVQTKRHTHTHTHTRNGTTAGRGRKTGLKYEAGWGRGGQTREGGRLANVFRMDVWVPGPGTYLCRLNARSHTVTHARHTRRLWPEKKSSG